MPPPPPAVPDDVEEAGAAPATGPVDGDPTDGDPGEVATGGAAPAPARLVAAWAGALGASVLLLVASLLPVPYVVERPGPLQDVLGEVEGTPLISVEGAPTHPTSGSLDLTTVRLAGGPGSSVDVLAVLVAWLHPDRVALPYDVLYGPGATAEEEERRESADMTASQDAAAAAALRELGYAVPTTLAVAAVPAGSPAAGHLLVGDVVQAVDGVETPDLPALRAALDAGEPGRSVVLTVLRDGERIEVTSPTAAGGGGSRVQLGVSVDVGVQPSALPVRVDIEVDRIGGPSAGLLFALGVVDLLTPGAMTGGERVAGTGTITADGEVGPVGGVAQKAAAAADAGVAAFLVPVDNCDDLVGADLGELRVVAVSTLAQARAAVEALGRGGATGLPTCSEERLVLTSS